MSFLANKTVIVTGASSGVGRAAAQELAERGARLVLSARAVDPLKAALEACANASHEAGFPGDHAMIAGSVAKAKVAESLVATAMNMGAFTGLIHAAGVLAPGPALWELDPDRFQDVFDASVHGAWMLIHTAMPALSHVENSFAVFLGSGAAEITQPGIAAYCAAKAAEEHMVRQLAVELPQVASMVYRPGIVDTPMQAKARASTGEMADKVSAVFSAWHERGELLTPQESACALATLIEGGVRRFHGGIATVADASG